MAANQKYITSSDLKTINNASVVGSGNININSCPYGVFGGNGVGAVTIGEGGAAANGDRCLAVGDAVAQGDNSFAVGNSGVEAGSYSIAFGFAPNWEEEGELIKAYLGGLAGGYALYGGKIMTQMPLDEHTEGCGAMALGFVDYGGIIKAEGSGARAQGFSKANNSQIYAAEDGSIAEGYAWDQSSIIASGLGAHAEGCASSDNANIQATNRGAHAEGSADEFSTILASGIGAHAEGMADISGNITASGDGSHAEGYGTIAQNNYEHAQGTFNKSNLTSAGTATQQAAGSTRFSVGIGTANNARANAFEVMVNGDTYIKGIGNYDGTNATASTSSTLQAMITPLIVYAVYDDMVEDYSYQSGPSYNQCVSAFTAGRRVILALDFDGGSYIYCPAVAYGDTAALTGFVALNPSNPPQMRTYGSSTLIGWDF